MGRKVLAAKSGRAACSCAAAGGGIAAKNAKDAKSLTQRHKGTEKMKPSGILWIGDIPDGWEVRRLRYLATSFRKGAGITRADVIETGDISCIRYGDIYSKYKNDVAVIKCISKTNRHLISTPQRIFKGDILFSCTGELVDEIGKNITYMGDEECLAGGDIIIVSHNQDPVFLSYALNSYVQTQKSHDKAKLKVVHISTGDIKNLLIVLPPLPVQRAIAAYLDEKCGAIDAAVAEAKKGIEEYKAWKKSLIFEVVTGKRRIGVFNAESQSRRVAEKMKSSGIPWIGDVPEGWSVKRLKSIFEYRKGLSITKADLTQTGIPVISYGQIHSKENTGTHLQDSLLRFVPLTYLESDGNCLLKEDDFVFADTSEDLEGLGNCAYVDRQDKIFAGYHTIIFRPYDDHRSEAIFRYLAYLFKTDVWRSQFRAKAFGIKVYSLSQRLLNDCRLILPSLSEQQTIADYLDEKCAAIDAMVADKEALIADLEAYKKSLIYETVTGKREVL